MKSIIRYITISILIISVLYWSFIYFSYKHRYNSYRCFEKPILAYLWCFCECVEKTKYLWRISFEKCIKGPCEDAN